jgi:hypothetical protein
MLGAPGWLKDVQVPVWWDPGATVRGVRVLDGVRWRK